MKSEQAEIMTKEQIEERRLEGFNQWLSQPQNWRKYCFLALMDSLGGLPDANSKD